MCSCVFGRLSIIFCRDGRNLEESVSRTLGWLQSELTALPGRLQVSADKNKLQQQVAKHEPLYRDLTQREHEIIMLLDKGMYNALVV